MNVWPGTLGAFCALLWLLPLACSKPVDEPKSDFKPAQGAPALPAPTKLESEDLIVGKGREAKVGDTVRVQYTGTLLSGVKFDSSYDHGAEPFKFTLGQSQVIKGWDQGVPGNEGWRKAQAAHPARACVRRKWQPANHSRQCGAGVRSGARGDRLDRLANALIGSAGGVGLGPGPQM